MPQLAVSTSLPLSGLKVDELYPVDIDGDGRLEWLCLQSAGIYQSDVFDDSKFKVVDWNKDVFCLTALTPEGKILWQTGNPELKRSYESHCACQMLDHRVVDGRVEVAVLRRDGIYLYDGASGELIRSRKLNNDTYVIVRHWQSEEGTRWVVKNTEKAINGHHYGDPCVVLDEELNEVFRVEQCFGSGHSPRLFDLEGEGEEVLLVGYEAYDAQGKRLWRATGEVFDEIRSKYSENHVPEAHHSDQCQFGRLGEKKERRVLYAGSRYAYAATIAGDEVWAKFFGHPQHVILGNFHSDERKAEIAFLNIEIGPDLVAYAEAQGRKDLPQASRLDGPRQTLNGIVWTDSQGEIQNFHYPESHWPSQPDNSKGCHSGEGILLLPQVCDNGSDALLLRDCGWPRAIDIDGQVIWEFAYPKMVKDDVSVHNDGYGIKVYPSGHPGEIVILMHNHSQIWTYRMATRESASRLAYFKAQIGQGAYALHRES